MKKLRVVTWNAEGMFVEGTKTRRALPHDALAVLRHLGADIVVVPEFGNIMKLRDEISVAIRSLGYQVSLAPYTDERAHGVGIAILSRLPIVSERQHQLTDSSQSCLEIHCRDTTGEIIRIIGVHLDDRSEETRMNQVVTVGDIVNTHQTLPTLLAGDFNAMHHDSRFARMVRSRLAGAIARNIKHELLSSIAIRVHEMGYGTTIRYIDEHTSLSNSDAKLRRTISAKQADLEWMPAIKLAKIDWIFGSKHFNVLRYRVMRDVGSDHRPIVVDFEY